MNVREKEFQKMKRRRFKQIERRAALIKEGKELFDYISKFANDLDERVNSIYWESRYYEMYIEYFDHISGQIEEIDELIRGDLNHEETFNLRPNGDYTSDSDDEYLARLKIFDGDLTRRIKHAEKYLKFSIRDLKELKSRIDKEVDDD